MAAARTLPARNKCWTQARDVSSVRVWLFGWSRLSLFFGRSCRKAGAGPLRRAPARATVTGSGIAVAATAATVVGQEVAKGSTLARVVCPASG